MRGRPVHVMGVWLGYIGMAVILLALLLPHASASAAKIPQFRESPRTSYACEGSTLGIFCTIGRIIRVIRANYGRFTLSVCNDRDVREGWNLQCMSTRSLNIVSNKCDGQQKCSIPATNRMFGDPCSDTYKYLQVTYQCVTKDEINPTKPYPTREVTTTSSTTTTTTSATSPTTTPTTTTTTTTKPPPPKPVTKCPAVRKREIDWPMTAFGAMVKMPCPNNRKATADWRCGLKGKWIKSPDLSRCVSPQMDAIKIKFSNGTAVEDVAHDIVEVTKKQLYGGDMKKAMTIMKDVVDKVELQVHNVSKAEGVEMIKNINKAVVKSSSNVLDSQQSDSWRDLPKEQRTHVATEMMNTVESSAFQLAKTLKPRETNNVIKVEINIMVQVRVVDTRGGVTDVVFPPKDEAKKDPNWKNMKDSIKLSGRALRDQAVEDGLARVVFLTYNNLNQWLNPEKDKVGSHEIVINPEFEEKTNQIADNGYQADVDNTPEKEPIVNTRVISASINERKMGTRLSEPIIYTLEHKKTSTNETKVDNARCSFWNYTEKTLDGEWSTFGCWVERTNDTHTTCACDHLTNFAVIMDIWDTELDIGHQFALMFITYIGCFVSIICLFLAWLTFQFFSNLQCDRNTIHKNLVLCLFLAEIIFLAGIAQFDKPVLCGIVAGLLHYFFLAAFAWMFLEGVQLYVMLIEVFEAERSRIRYYYIGAYGLPALIVAIAASIDHSSYGTDKHCWLRADNGFIWAFVGPVICIISVNIVMLSIAIYMMCRHASMAASLKVNEKSKGENIRSWVKGAAVLVVLLGLTWTFGLLFVNKHSVVMAYIFTFLNSLQGLFIFIFHCIMNEKVQKEYKRCIRRSTWLPECIRVKYGGVRRYSQSTSPPPSSSSGNKFSVQYFQKLLSGRRRKRSSTTSLQKSSSSNPSKWHFHNMKGDVRHPTDPMPERPLNCNSEPTEDPDGYLEPVKIRIDDSEVEHDYSAINGDLSMIDGSVVDTEGLSEYCRQNLRVTNDRNKSKNTQLNRLSALSNDKCFSESEYSDGELFSMTEKEKMLSEYEQQPLVPKTVSEQNLVNNLMNEEPNKLGNDSPSLNDLNKDESEDSRKSIYLSTPNIKFKPGTEPKGGSDNTSNSDFKRSLPNLVQDDDKGTASELDDIYAKPNGQVYEQKSTAKRMGSDPQLTLKLNRQGSLSSSDS